MVQVVATNPNLHRDEQVKSNQTRAPVWKTVVKVVLIIVAVAAAIYIGAKFIYPAVVKLLAGVGTAAAGAVGVATEAAETVGAAASVAKHAIKGVHTAITVVDKVLDAQGTAVALTKSAQDALTITTSAGQTINPGAMQSFIKNPFVGILDIIIGAFK